MASNCPTLRLEMRGVRKAFGATVALAGVDFAVAAGEIHALVGENGAGKSTLMKILAGAHRPDAGEIWLDGQPYRPRDPHDARRAGVAMIYQELALAPHLTVLENIWLGMEPPRREQRPRAAAALEQLGHGDLALDARVGRLSLAQQQIVEIARALACGCRVLVLDEPTSSLSAPDIERLFALVRRLKAAGQAIVYISHFLEEVKAIADRFTVLRDGCSVGTGDTASTPVSTIIALMVGRAVQDLYPRTQRSPGAVVLEVSDLAGRQKPTAATLALRRGEVLGIAGLVGAGRTELLRAIFGLDPVRRGQISIGIVSPRQRWAQGVGMLSEDRKTEGLATGMSVADNVTLPTLPCWVRPRWQKAATARWAQRLKLRYQQPRQRVAELSGGNQQKVALARLLEANVDVLLLDEPTRGIDVGSKAEIYRLIDELAASGKAILMVSSYLPELLGVCDRIAVMRRGRLGAARPVAEWTEHALLTEATGAGSNERVA